MKNLAIMAVLLWFSPASLALGEPASGSLGVFNFMISAGREAADPVINDVPGFGRLSVSHVRAAIIWDHYEPEKGKFDLNNPDVKRIDAFLAKGVKVVPTIRALSRWAVKNPEVKKCASAPRDMVGTQNQTYGYSESYYNFIRNVAERYKGKFEYVVIENEMHSENFWCGSMDEYLRLLATARKAYKDVDPGIKISDGGIQGGTLCWLVLQDYVDRGRTLDAMAFLRKFQPEQGMLKRFERMVSKKSHADTQRNASYLLKNGMGNLVDVLNFHSYQTVETLPEIIAYLKRQVNKPLMTNEVGIKLKDEGGLTEAAKELTKKLTVLLALDVKPIIWFSPPGQTDTHTGAIVSHNQSVIEPTMSALRTAVRFLDRPVLSSKDMSSGNRAFYSFTLRSEIVDVAWNWSGEGTVDLRSGCKAYDYVGNRLQDAKINLRNSPIYIECPR